jgi:hypothetical protein
MKHVSPFAVALTSLLAACSGTPGGKGPVSNGATKGDPTAADSGPAGPCNFHTGFLGDDMCIPPPNPGEGIQLHVGPASYDDPDALAPYLLAAGDENVRCFLTPVPESGFYYLRQQNRMRPSSHHMLINLENGTGLVAGPTTVCDISTAVASIPGSQTPSRDFPSDLGPEDQGLARFLPASTMASFQLHYVNLGTEAVLREAWVNLYKDTDTITQHLQSVFLVGDLAANIPPQSRQTTTLEYAPPITTSTRVFELNAHMHAHSETFTVWREHGGQEDLIYESFDWNDPKELTFNTVVQNQPPDTTSRTDGGVSGLLYLDPGDKLKWACDVNNTTDLALHFANEAHTAEMCLLAGAYISDTPGLMRGACANGQCAGR